KSGGGAGNLHRIYGFIAWRDWTTGWAGDEWAGVPVIYLAAAGLVAIALLLTWRLKKRPPEHVPEAASSS
ncbi:hypothetical protein, partial [Pseudomonas aeruginosa]|uniref:hypothetical protein n=1 Tax=Pseudomonas aeruginosa TaxID=287 RepID=UPI0031B731A9